MESPNYKRPSRADTFFKIVQAISERGTCERAKVGCIIVKGERIISTGYNGPLPDEHHCSPEVCDISKSCTRAVHAELNALMFAARNGISTEGATVYCTYAPCPTCAGAMIQAGIELVVFLKYYSNSTGINLLLKHGIGCKLHHEDNL